MSEWRVEAKMSGVVALIVVVCIITDEYGWAAFLMWVAWIMHD